MFSQAKNIHVPYWIKLIRPHQWIKNLFLFLPAFFAGILYNYSLFANLFLGFLAFSFAASSIYIFNDIQDAESDRNHPIKKYRPIAFGKISSTLAYVMMGILLSISISICYFLSSAFSSIVILYLFLNLFYSLGLKKIAILDIIIVSSGFVFRTLSGGIIADVPVSKWLVLMIFLLALFLAMAKRLDDLLLEKETGIVGKKNEGKYNIPYTTSGITMLAGILIVCYIMYSISEDVMGRQHSDQVYLTSIFVIAGILRYLQIILVENKRWSPTRVLYKDPFIIGTVFLWAASFIFIIYF
ncbi:4-hydroxybenzoate polyprenyltransferase [Marivirga sericea]|uniref:4-hydroxybenzoate polyprenyltransferase n=1 Tax=Marivirga sericea TaxID=1028 RepID=A0A1X7KL37_9BACT|nr:UbiA prenyltransferase family protein [Marivirga sericea]SMG41859.1 4-hydroxybenzoate polyprenyltransferase [Marivirga sericea]